MQVLKAKRFLCLILSLSMLLPMLPAALAENPDSVNLEDLYEIAMTPHLDGYTADPETMTDEQWAAQFACDEYVVEGNAALELSQMAASDINPIDFLKMIMSMKNLPDLIKQINFWSLDYLWKAFIKGDGEDAKFKAIMKKLKDIEDKLDKLTQGHKIDVYEKYLNEQLKARTQFVACIRDVLNDLADVDDALNRKDDKRITKEEAVRLRKKAISKWGKPMMNVTDGVTATFSYINYVMQQRIRGKTFFGMLDDYVYVSLPWEHQGYLARDLLRSAEMSTMFAAMALSGMYLNMEGKLDSRTGKDLNKLILEVAKWFEKQPVVRNKDISTCQIRGEQGSKFWRGTIDFSERLTTGETIEYNIKKWQMREKVNDYEFHGNTADEDDPRKAKVAPLPAWEIIMNFYGNKKTAEEIWQKEIEGHASAVRFICFNGFLSETERTQNNTLVTTRCLYADDKDTRNWRHDSWVGFYWEDNCTTYVYQRHVRGWHRTPDDRAVLIPYEKGILIRPDSAQDQADEYIFTFSGPVALASDGYLAVLNVTNTDFMYGDEPDAPPPPVLEAPEGGMVTDLFSVADTYLSRDLDVRGLDLGDGLKPGQWVTVTGTISDSTDIAFYKAIDVQPMDIAGVPGTVTQLSDDMLTFLPEDGAEMALVVNDSALLGEDIAEGSQVTLFYHPELVYNDDENGFCDHQQLVLDRVDPYDLEEGTLDGTVSALMAEYLTVLDDEGVEHAFLLTEESQVDEGVDEGERVLVSYHIPKDPTSLESDLPVADGVALMITPIAPEEDPLALTGTIEDIDETTLTVLGTDDESYAFNIESATILGEPALGNNVYVTYHVSALSLEAETVTCFAPDDDPDDDVHVDDDPDDDVPTDDDAELPGNA